MFPPVCPSFQLNNGTEIPSIGIGWVGLSEVQACALASWLTGPVSALLLAEFKVLDGPCWKRRRHGGRRYGKAGIEGM